jgi:ankyrin repeat protein
MRFALLFIAFSFMAGLAHPQGVRKKPTLEDRFMEAVRDRNAVALKTVLAEGLPVNKLLSSGSTPLSMVSLWDEQDMVEVMLKAGANPNSPDRDGKTPLMSAAQNLSACEALMAHGARIDAHAEDGRTAMHFAVDWYEYDFHPGGTEERAVSVLELLFAAGADPEVRDRLGRTPMMLAALNGHDPSIETLLKHGAKVNARDNAGRAAVTWASSRGETDKCLVALLAAGAKIHLIEALELNNLALAAKCFSRGDDVKAIGPYGDTTLCRAAELGDLGLVQALIKAGVAVNRADDGGVTALHLACAARPGFMQTGGTYWPPLSAPQTRPAIVRALIQAGAKVDVTTHGSILSSDGDTPLIWAARASTPEVVAALIEGGADVNRTSHDKDGQARNPLGSILSELDYRRDDPYRVQKAIVLLKAGADPSRIPERGPLSRFFRAFAKSNEIGDLSLAKHPDVNAPDDYGVTALMEAVENPYAVRRLLELGAKVDSTDRWRTTALMRAAQLGREDSVKLLLAAGASRTAKDERGRTAQQFAIEANHPELAALIASYKRVVPGARFELARL